MKPELTYTRLKELMHYDPETGIFTWLVDRHANKVKGTKAGSISVHGYNTIHIDGKMYRSSRLAFLYMTGKWPKSMIDHKNRIKNDDRWCNLRTANRSQNRVNTVRNVNNKSGYKGVYWRKRDLIWEAQIRVDKKLKYLGCFNTPEEASLAYQKASQEYFGEFVEAF